MLLMLIFDQRLKKGTTPSPARNSLAQATVDQRVQPHLGLVIQLVTVFFWDIVTLIMHTYDLSAPNCFDQQ